jgi:ABC-2 type transport system permease protein
MNKTLTILKHEFLVNVKRRSFILITLAFPLIGFLAISGYAIFQDEDGPSPEDVLDIGYIDNIGIFDDFREQYKVNLIPYETAEEATDALISENLDEYFIIPEDYVENGTVIRFTTERQIEPPAEIWPAIKNFLIGNLLGEELTAEELIRAQYPLNLASITLDEAGQISDEQGGLGVFLVPYIFGLLLMMSIFTSSGYLLQGMGEEKEYRIMEILLSSVSAKQLITGKVLGLGATGLLQILFWVISAKFLLGLSSSTIGGVFGEISLTGSFLVIAPLYFILGYLLFAVLMAGVGAVTSSARDGQQMAVIFTLPAALPFMLQFFLLEHPDSFISHFLTVFPITAPVATIIRLGSSDIPLWELALSITIMIITIIGALWLAAKIFRTFLLMYGKTPKVSEIFKSLRQA